MALKGALFDCDGTILDSMPMWTTCCVTLLERYGVDDAMRVFLEHESLDMDKKCFWYHENLGIGESGEALYRELWDMVSEAYERDVRPYVGCRDFLQRIASMGVPCAIVSSTPTELVEHALRVHGLIEFFSRIVFVGDVGRSKEHSDCYLAAARQLGTPLEDTWVFEDAPFGVRSATRAGMPVVAILNNHDGRDPSFMKSWSLKVVSSYAGLDVDELESLAPRITHAMVVAGSPERCSTELISQCAGDADVVIAADAGLNVLHDAAIVPDVCCGDLDSAAPEAIDWARALGTRFDVLPTEKDMTDLTESLTVARILADERRSALRLTVACALGGRPDHALGVWGVLASHASMCPRVVDDGMECRVLSGVGECVWEIDAPPQTTVSVVALASGTVVSERGFKWNLESRELGFMDDLGISNQTMGGRALIVCEAGVIAAFCLT